MQIPHSYLLDRPPEDRGTATPATESLVMRRGGRIHGGISGHDCLSRNNSFLDLNGRPGVMIISERHAHLLRRLELDQGIFFIGVLAALSQQVLRRYVVIAILDYLLSIQEGVLCLRIEEVD